MTPPSPHPEAVVAALDWLRAGCPVVSQDHDAKAAVKTLLAVCEVLPRLAPVYRFGSPEWRESMGLPKAEEDGDA